MRFILMMVFVGAIALQFGCSGAEQDCASLSQSCLLDCANNSAFSETDRFQCESACADDAFACVDKNKKATPSLAEDDDVLGKVDVEAPAPPLTKKEWSYVSIGGMALLAGGVTAAIICGTNPVCLAATAASIGLASYKYKAILRGARLNGSGLITSVTGISSTSFNLAWDAAKSATDAKQPERFTSPDRIDDFNRALTEALAHYYKLWQ